MTERAGVSPRASEGYVAWNGPIEFGREPDQAALRFKVAAHHVNTVDRLHGGLSMGAMAWAMRHAAVTQGAPHAALCSMHVDFVDSARPGETVEVHAELTRSTRTLIFVRATLRASGRIAVTGSGIFRRTPARNPMRTRPASQEEADSGYSPAPVSAPFSRHAGPVQESSESGCRHWALRIQPQHLERGSDAADVSAALMLADVALGLCALEASGGKPSATLSLDVSVLGIAHAGDLLRADCRHLGMADDVHVMSAQLCVGDSVAVAILGNWKQAGQREAPASAS